ncbi:MAG TPA: tetratricopeptide repeat protein [Planctomycetota bacterium]|nr:tetratricopeptide repeat protein [Planctomycetota bacterium]
MLKASKEKVLMTISILFLGLVVWMITFNQGKIPDEWVLSQKPKTYYPTPPKDSSGDLNKLEVARRNPFISTAEKVESRIDLSLPDITEKQYTLIGFQPAPDLRFYSAVTGTNLNKGLLKTAFGKIYPYDDSARLTPPAGRALPPMEPTLNLLINKIHEPPKPPDTSAATPEEDIITTRTGTKIPGKYVSEDKDVVYFVKSGQSGPEKVVSYNKTDIADIQRVYTPEEQYEMEIKKVSATDAYSWFRLSEWCLKKGLADKAVAALKESLKINDHELKFYLALADYYFSKKDFDSEIKLYRQALKSSVINPDMIYYRLGNAYERLKLLPEARLAYEKAVGLTPNYNEALLRLADLYRQKQDYDAAFKTYERIRNFRNPDNAYLEGLGLLQYQTGKMDEARQSLLEAQKNADLSSEALNLMGMLDVLNGDYNKAGEKFLYSINLKPNLSSGWTNLGLLYLSAGLYAEAEMLFTEYIELNPIDETPYIGLGYLKWLTNKTDDAVSFFQKALKMAPDSFQAHYALGQLYFYLQQYPEAQPEFQWCLANTPSYTETLGYLATISLYQKNTKEALKYYKAYFAQLPPELISAADESNLVMALINLDNTEQAKKILNQSERLKKYVPAINLAAYLDYKELNPTEAIIKLEMAMSLDPSNLWARNSGEKIKESSSQAISVDPFDRPDSAIIGHGWTETEKYGVEISIANKQCLFKGVQSLTKDGLTTLEKTVSRASFIKFEARLNIDTESALLAGIYLAGPAKEKTLFIARKKPSRTLASSSGQEIVYGFSTKPDAPPVEWSSFAKPAIIAENSKISLEIQGATERPTEYHCFVDDVLCGIIQLKGALTPVGRAQDTSYLLGIFGYGPLGQEWQMAVKNARVFEEKVK